MANETITNNDMHNNKTQLFNNRYNTPQAFAGRIREKEELVKEINDETQKLVLISDLPGSGKSKLIEVGLSQTKYQDEKPNTIRNIEENILTKYPFIIIDDIDIENNYVLIENKLKIINKILSKKALSIFLIGDYILKNKNLISIFSNIQKQKQIIMDPLSKELLFEALDLILFKERKKKINRDIFEIDVLNYLIPNTVPKIATFKKVFDCLKCIVNELPENNDKCMISANEVRAWMKKEIIHFPEEEQRIFYRFLLQYIRANYNPKNEMKAIETSKFREMCPIKGINTDDEYEEKILKPFAEKNILISVGIPFEKDTHFAGRYPDPYLPSIKTFLDAKFGSED